MGPRAGRTIRGVTGTQEGDICPPNFLKYGKAGALISAAASGAVCQWQTPSTDRSGNVAALVPQKVVGFRPKPHKF